MNTILNAVSIKKSFSDDGENREVIKKVNLSIEEGEFVSVMGPSGSGKSTLLFCISGMERVDSGSIRFGENELTDADDTKLSELRRKEMGFVFQQPSLLKNLNLLDNILLTAMRIDRRNAAAHIHRAKELMERTGILELADRDITKVSGGQLQRAGICRALMNRPRIIFGDEPTGALNSVAAQEIMELLTEINSEGTAVMLVTHDAKVAARTGRVLYMKDGEIISERRLTKCRPSDSTGRINLILEDMQQLGI
jgi:putative ABC transport system ATP-binding protein